MVRNLSPGSRAVILCSLLALLGAGAYFWRESRNTLGVYEAMAHRVNAKASSECDLATVQRRLGLSKVMDRHRSEIRALWENRKKEEFPNLKMERVGPIFLRLNPEGKIKNGFDITSWSWEEAYALFLRTQRDPDSPENMQRWRDLDTLVKFLLEKDVGRILLGRPYLSPDKAIHQFRPSKSVKRISAKEFEVRLHPGDFSEDAEKLKNLFEQEWKSAGYTVRVVWDMKDPSLFRVKALFKSGRSYVNHRERILVIANFSWARTVAHELGHILGFDDHYYSVWNERNCYYTQESRLADLMSNSESGRLGARHWELLNQAYPLRKTQLEENFSYQFGK